jgi:List-Bact-rpt repeat protein
MTKNGIVALAIALTASGEAAYAQTVRIGIAPTKRRPTVATNMPVATSASISAARNEFEAFEAILWNNGASQIAAVDAILTPASLTGPGGHVIPSANIRIFREGYAHTLQASTTDVPTGDWPDIMIPRVDEVFNETRCAFFAMGPLDANNANLSTCNASCSASCGNDFIPAGQNRVFYVEVLVPTWQDPPTNSVKTAAGHYTGTLHVSWSVSGAPGSQDVPVDVHVRDFDLPSTASLKSLYFIDMCGVESVHGKNCLAAGGSWTADDLPTRLMYTRFILDHRTTPEFIYLNNLVPFPGTYPADFRRPNGFEDSFAPILNGTDPALRLKGAMPTTIFYTWKYMPNMNQSTFDSDDQIMHQGWAQEFKTTTADTHAGTSLSWWARTVDRVCDEPLHDTPTPAPGGHIWNCGFQTPFKGNNVDSWVTLHERTTNARALVSDFQTMGTMPWTPIQSPTVASDINIFTVPNIYMWDKPGNSIYDSFQRAHYGSPVWWYNGCGTHGCGGTGDASTYYSGWPSPIIDVPFPAQNRTMEWFAWRYNIAGEHYYEMAMNIATAFASGGLWARDGIGGNGDGTLVYPGTTARIGGTHDIPLASLRMKMIRAGVQDYEYLLQCAAKDTPRATAAVDTLFRSGSPPPPYSSNVAMEDLYLQREQLASCAEASSTPPNPKLFVQKAGSGSGTVTSSPAGINCGPPATCSKDFAPGTVVTLSAVADLGSTFVGFTGGPCAGGQTCVVTVNSNVTVTATFTAPCTSSDCFNRSDSADLGSNWNTYSPTLGISAGQARNTDAGAKASQFLQSVGPDQDVTVDCLVTAAGSNCGLMGRWSDANNHYYAFFDSGISSLYLFRVQGGVLTGLGSASRSIGLNTYNKLRLLIQGSSLSLYFNSETTPAISAIDGALTTGNYGGLHAYAGGAQTVWYKDFNIVATATCTMSDCFNRPDSTNLGPNWNTYSPSLEISAGQVRNSDTGAKASQFLQSVGADQDVVVDCKVTASGSNCGLMGRWANSSNHYYAFFDVGFGAMWLFRVQAGVATQLGSATRALTANTYYKLRLLVQGTSVSVFFNSEPTAAIAVTDSGLTSGNYGGLHAYAGAAQAVWYKDFNIVAAPLPALFSDGFNRTTGLGSNWIVPAGGGSFTTNGSSAVSGAPPLGGNWAKVNVSLPTNNVAVVARLMVPSFALYSGVVARSGSAGFDSQLYSAQISTDGTVHLYARDANWGWISLGSAPAGITANTWYTLKLVAVGTNPVHLEAWLDGALKVVVDDSTYHWSGSGVGIENYDANVQYDSFTVLQQ